MSLQMVKSHFANMFGKLVLADWVVEENHSKATYTEEWGIIFMCFENNLCFHDNGKLGISKPTSFSVTAPPEATNSSAPYVPYCCAGGQQK